MKNIFTTLLFLLFSFSTLMAQVTVGPKVGFNLASINSSEKPEAGVDEGFLPGYNAGMAANFNFTDILSLYSELIYTQKGERVTTTFTFLGIREERFKEYFIQMPLFARGQFGGSQAKVFVHAGPSFGYWLGGKIKTETTFNDTKTEEESNIKFVDEKTVDPENIELLNENYNRFEVGIGFGFGFLYKAGPGLIQFDTRYYLGMNDLNKQDPNLIGEQQLKNSLWSFSLAYLFQL